MTFFDVVAGYTISIVAAEHDLGLGRAGGDQVGAALART